MARGAIAIALAVFILFGSYSCGVRSECPTEEQEFAYLMSLSLEELGMIRVAV